MIFIYLFLFFIVLVESELPPKKNADFLCYTPQMTPRASCPIGGSAEPDLRQLKRRNIRDAAAKASATQGSIWGAWYASAGPAGA